MFIGAGWMISILWELLLLGSAKSVYYNQTYHKLLLSQNGTSQQATKLESLPSFEKSVSG